MPTSSVCEQPALHRRRRRRPRKRLGTTSAVALTVMTLVAGTVAVTSVALDAAPAQARYAQSGSGLYQNSIDWFEWGAEAAAIPPEGLTRTNSRVISGQTLSTTCTLSDLSGGALTTYRAGTWIGDALDDLYNIGGTGTANQIVSGIANVNPSAQASFRFECSAAFDGRPVPLQGLVVADAEASNIKGVGGIITDEYIEARPEQAATWRIIDRYRGEGCPTNTQTVLSPDGTLRFVPDGRECITLGHGAGPMAVGFMDGATSARVTVQGGGRSAVALGVMLEADYGDAPTSYGSAGAIFEPGWEGGTVELGTTAVSGSDFLLASQASPSTRLGNAVDADDRTQASADALGDDTTGLADEDGIAPPGTIHVAPGETYTLNDVACTGPGSVVGWIDWNHDGLFDDAESSNLVPCENGRVSLDWTVPEGAVATVDGDKTFMRLRISTDTDAVTSPTGLTFTGEVEDYSLSVALPSLSIAKTSTASAETRPGDIITYTVTAKNIGLTPFTSTYPAVVFDDMTGVLDDATFNNDALASRPGELSYGDPLLSWRGSLASGDEVTITYSVVVTGAGDGVARNVAWVPTDPTTPTTPACEVTTDGNDSVTGEPCDSVTFILPKLKIEKTADVEEVTAVGDIVTYTVKVTNVGPGVFTADNPATMTVDLSDVLASATYNNDESATTGTASYTEPTVSWSGALDVGETASITYSAAYSGQGDHVLRNAACVDVASVAHGATACDSVETPGAQLSQFKAVQADATPVVAGTKLTYTLTFRNDGQTLASVNASDDLTHVLDDGDITSEPVASEGLSVSRTDSKILITGSIPRGATATVTYTVTVRPDGQRGDDRAVNFLLSPTDPPATDADCVPVDPQAPNCTATPIGALETGKTVSADTPYLAAGSVLTYTLTFRNSGAGPVRVDAVDVLADVLDDADVTLAPAASDSALSVGAVVDGRFSVSGQLDAGQVVTVVYQVTVRADSDRGNSRADNFLVPSGELPPTMCLDSDRNCTSTPIPVISVVKTADPAAGTPLVAGDDVAYTLSFTNTGDAAGFVDYTDHLTDVLDDAELTANPTASDESWTVADGSSGVIRVTGELAPHTTVTVTYAVRVLPDGQRTDNWLRNVVAPTSITEPTCDLVDAACTEHPIGQIIASKSVDPASGTTVQSAQVLTYTLRFENVGAGSGVVAFDDDLTKVLDDAEIMGDPVSSDAAVVASTTSDGRLIIRGELAAGAVATVTYTVAVQPAEQRGDNVLDNFLVSPGETPAENCRAEDAMCTTNPVGDLIVHKTSDPQSGEKVLPGQLVTYTLTFTNTAPLPDGADALLDYTDDLSQVLDDADVTMAATSSSELVHADMSGSSLRLTGSVPAQQTVTVVYGVTVHSRELLGDSVLANVVVPTGVAAVCTADASNCTEHTVPPEPEQPTPTPTPPVNPPTPPVNPPTPPVNPPTPPVNPPTTPPVDPPTESSPPVVPATPTITPPMTPALPQTGVATAEPAGLVGAALLAAGIAVIGWGLRRRNEPQSADAQNGSD